MVRTNKRKMYKNTNKRKTRKNKTRKNKRKTYRRKNKRTIGSGKYDKSDDQTPDKTPYSRQEQCKYGFTCKHYINPGDPSEERARKEHLKRFKHPSPEIYLQYLYDAFKKYGSIRHSITPLIYNLQYNSELTQIKNTFYYELLTYIAINRCELARKYGKEFFKTLLLTEFEERNVSGLFPVFKDDAHKPQYLNAEPELWKSLDESGGEMRGLNRIEIVMSFNNNAEWNGPEPRGLGIRNIYSDIRLPTPDELETLPRIISNTGLLAAIERC